VPIIRKLYVTDQSGVEHEIKSKADLMVLLAKLTPEERKQYELNYRFCPVTNKTGNPFYTGTQIDTL